jgi:hypothetical protein
MHALRNTERSRGSRDEATVDGLAEIGIRSGARLRQWHLDLILLGGLTAAAARSVPDPPRKVAVPLAVGAWVDAYAFGVLPFRPERKEHLVHEAGVAGSSVSPSWASSAAAVACKRRLMRR